MRNILIIIIILSSFFVFGQSEPLILFDSGVTYGNIPNYEAVGLIAQGTTSVAVPHPSGISANDILIMQINIQDAASGGGQTAYAPSGWTKADSVKSANNAAYIFWKRADGTETGNLTVTGSADVDDMKGIMSRWSGCITDGTPYESLANGGFITSNTMISQQITTLNLNRLAVCFDNIFDDVSAGAMTNYAEIYDTNTLLGSPDATFVCNTLDVVIAEVVASDTGTVTDTDIHVVFTLALKPTEN